MCCQNYQIQCVTKELNFISANNFLRGKIKSTSGRYEDGSGQLRELPIDFDWTHEQGKTILEHVLEASTFRTSAEGFILRLIALANLYPHNVGLS